MSLTQSDTIQKVFIGVIVAVVTFLGTVAMAGSGSISRIEAESMVHTTEDRLNLQINELKTQQSLMSAKIDQILSEQIKTSTKLELLTGGK